ncbi:MAG: hypothetical protein J6A99_05010 [Clostridia bacterium]|nr:hypothetical protein [Clostridia bacterium]
MKKKLLVFLLVLVFVFAVVGMVACSNDEGDGGNTDGGNTDNGNTQEPLKKFEGITFKDATFDFDGQQHTITCEGVPEGASVEYTNNSKVEDGVYNAKAVVSKEGYETATYNAKLTIKLTSQRVVDARQNSVNLEQQNYDFNINLNGTIKGVSANANYEGYYRYNKTSQDLKFKRITSGVLLYDAIEYIYNTGSSKVKLVANEDNVVKRSSVVPQEDEELNLINLPFSAIVDHMDANNLVNITKLSSGNYQYKATLKLASDNKYLNKLFTMMEKLGTDIEIKEVSLSNPAAGVDFYFNMNTEKTLLTGFKYEAQIAFPVKSIPVTISLKYEQKDSKSAIVIPSTTGLITSSAEISSTMNSINSAINALRVSDTYSLDLEAKNEFDPGFSTMAIVDKYMARMYKNTNDGRVDFNHSYEYKAHTEEDGAETFKYTIGNIQDGTVHQVSRKGNNEITALDGVSANTQFDYLVGAAKLNATDVDCISKEEKDGSVFYYIYATTTKTLSIKDKITEIINSNDAEGVMDVDNYFNNDKYDVKDSEIVIEMKAGKIVNISVSTKIKYVPTAGEYSQDKITLTNTIELTVNENLDKAAEYEAPKKTTTSLGSFGLNNAKYYIR